MNPADHVEVRSFLEVPENASVKVVLDDQSYQLGYVLRVHANSVDYVVWEDNENRIWYETSNRDLVKAEDFHKFWNLYQIARSRSLHNLREDAVAPYLKMLSSSLASALEGQFMAAAEALEAASTFIKTANERVSRRRYTTGAIVALVLFLVTSGSLALFLAQDQILLDMARIATLGGSLGAVLSALAGKRSGLGFDPDATQSEAILNGAMRVVYGVISAFVAVLVFKSGIVSTPLITQENESLALVVVAIAGGFAERWAADLIQRFSSETETKPDRD